MQKKTLFAVCFLLLLGGIGFFLNLEAPVTHEDIGYIDSYDDSNPCLSPGLVTEACRVYISKNKEVINGRQ